jgi:hypothetical protein
MPRIDIPSYPTKEERKKHPTWDVAFVLSEIMNDNAPIGWKDYLYAAEALVRHYDIEVPDDHPTS